MAVCVLSVFASALSAVCIWLLRFCGCRCGKASWFSKRTDRPICRLLFSMQGDCCKSTLFFKAGWFRRINLAVYPAAIYAAILTCNIHHELKQKKGHEEAVLATTSLGAGQLLSKEECSEPRICFDLLHKKTVSCIQMLWYLRGKHCCRRKCFLHSGNCRCWFKHWTRYTQTALENGTYRWYRLPAWADQPPVKTVAAKQLTSLLLISSMESGSCQQTLLAGSV